jgi:hypothetical protein
MHAGAQHELRDEQGHFPDFSKLLGTAEGLLKNHPMGDAERDLGTVQGARDALYGPHTSLSPAQDSLWHCFEVLEATGNIMEDTLKGGGFYSPEGFPFQNM